jgi:hypothetical protein
VPAGFWWARGHAALQQNWHSGDFETWINHKIHCRAYGVKFRLSDIEAMLPARRSSHGVEAAEPGNFSSARRCLVELTETVGFQKQEAVSNLIRFCRAGLIASRCDEIRWETRDRLGSNDHEMGNAAIPDWFWEHCTGDSDSVLDWNSGNLSGRGEIDCTLYIVRMRGVQFDVAGIVELERMLLAGASGSDMDASKSEGLAVSAPPTGRPRSEKWSDWIAELVALVHEEGVPDGLGSEGQDPIIAAIDSRLIERGKEGPSRSTVQPVVRAVLQRLRSAEK